MNASRCGDRLGRVVAAKVGEELPVREALLDVVRPVQDQRGLARARRPGDHLHRHHDVATVLAGQNGVQLTQFVRTVDEVAHVSGKLAGCRAGSPGVRRPVEVDAPTDVSRLDDIAR